MYEENLLVISNCLIFGFYLSKKHFKSKREKMDYLEIGFSFLSNFLCRFLMKHFFIFSFLYFILNDVINLLKIEFEMRFVKRLTRENPSK